MNPRTRLREIVAQPGLSVWPGAYDALSARLIERAGFDAVLAGGYAAIGSLMAEPDMGQSNVRDYADHYARIVEAVDVPVFVDGDTGFGGLHNVRQMVRSFEAAGVAGIFFSDQVFPNRCGYLPGKEIVTGEQMLARVYSALDARRDDNLVIVARTDAFGVEGLDAAVERCQLFMEAGADAALAQGVDDLAGIGRVVAEVRSPFLAIVSQAAGRPKASLAELDAAGASAVILPSISLFAAAAAVSRVLRTVRSTGLDDSVFDDLIGLEEYYDVVGLADTLTREETADVRARELLRARAGDRT